MSHDDVATVLFLLALVSAMISGIFFVIFGQVTVRKLRKDPNTKDLLGMEFVSGWDLQNVAIALSWPRSFVRRVDKGRLAFLHANSDAIYRHTTKLDRFLGRAFFWMLMVSGVWLVVCMIYVANS